MADKSVDPVVLREFVSAVRDASSSKVAAKEYLSGVVTHTDVDGTVWVDVAGGVNDMPVARSTASYSPGDVVSFSIENGVASIGGNASDPAAPVSKQVTVEKKVLRTEELVEKIGVVVATKADIQDLNAANAEIEKLQAADVTITGKLTAAEGDITGLKAKDVAIEGNITAATGRIDVLESDNVSVKGRLTAAEGNITTLQSTKADISVLESDYITADSIEATYMHVNMSNSDVAWIQNGVIANGAISSAMINDVSANKLTAGTINGSVINVTNLNADNITAGTINGQRIGAGSLSLDKLSEDVYTEAEVDAMLDTMQAEIDGAIETWTGTEVPTLNNAPASSWTTVSDRDKHVGDVYFNTTSGYNYRFTKSGTGSSTTYSWLQIKDTDITNALQRIQTAEGKITTFDSDISTLKTDTGMLKTKTTSLETSLGDKVDTSTFNELSSTVEENSASITSMSTVLTNNGLTSSTNITNTVNTVSQTASGNSSKISQLTTTLGTNADGTTKENDIVHRASAIEQDVSGFKQTVSETYATNTTVNGIEGRVSTAESTITQHATDIEAKVSKDGVIAAINLSTEQSGGSAVKISADKVNITGEAVFSAINNDTGTTKINGGKIDTESITIGPSQVTGLVDALKNTYVSIRTTAIDYAANTATLEATLYVDGTPKTTGVTYAWLIDGTDISGATAQTYLVPASSGLGHAYSCKVTY